jgi:hypothetical protein
MKKNNNKNINVKKETNLKDGDFLEELSKFY